MRGDRENGRGVAESRTAFLIWADACEADEVTMSSRQKPNSFAADLPCKQLKRVNYHFGQVLSQDDFVSEQNYFLEKHRRHNRVLHRPGVMSGLEVTVQTAGLQVGPGLALDREGNEICVPVAQVAPMPPPSSEVFVVLRYEETPTDPVPALTESEANGQIFSRIKEGFTLTCEAPTATQPKGDICGVRLARLTRVGGKWRVDPHFRRPKAK